jgi:hypothetical protein
MPAPPLELTAPAEPLELRERTRALAEQDPAGALALLDRGEWIAGPLWDCWGAALARAGLRRQDLLGVLVDYRRELWLWLMGERTWAQCAAGLAGRIRRRGAAPPAFTGS